MTRNRVRRRAAPNVTVKLHFGDCRKLAKPITDTISFIYCDMSGGLYPWRQLLQMLNGNKLATGLMFFNATGYKRQVAIGRGMPLTQFFKQLRKKYVYVQMAIAAGKELVFIYASDQVAPEELGVLDFHSVKSAAGRRLLYTITHNKEGQPL